MTSSFVSATYATVGKIIAVANQKGGVGKTTTSINIASYLCEFGRSCLIVDMDPQGNATSGLGIFPHQVPTSIYDVLVDGKPAKDILMHTTVERLDLLPSNSDMFGAEIALAGLLSREQRLRSALDPLRPEYDLILIDCPPALGLLTINSLAAADFVLIPVQCEYYALEGLGQLLQTVEAVKKHLRPELQSAGILMTMYDGRTNLASQVCEEVRKHFPKDVFAAVIPRNVRLSEAPSHGKPIGLYDRGSRGAEAYREAAIELAHRIGLSVESEQAPSVEAATQTTAPTSENRTAEEAAGMKDVNDTYRKEVA